jgi:hypothetical protein
MDRVQKHMDMCEFSFLACNILLIRFEPCVHKGCDYYSERPTGSVEKLVRNLEERGIGV